MKDGILLIHKETSWTSFDVVSKVRSLINRPVGHSGTLDPLASGLLVLLIGKATKLSDDFLKKKKAYHVKIRFGIQTDTLDLQGKILKKERFSKDPLFLKRQALLCQGKMKLKVPAYSAKKIKGKRSYKLARRGENVELYASMNFYNLKVFASGKDWIQLSLDCDKGSYIRSWAEYLGQRLDTFCVVESLERFYSEPFSLEEACSIKELEKKLKEKTPVSSFIPIEELKLFYDLFYLENTKDKKLMKNGCLPFRLQNQLKKLQRSVDLSNQKKTVGILSAKDRQMISVLDIRPKLSPRIRCVFS